MLRIRVLLTVVALVAVPFAAGLAQDRGQQSTKCNADQAAALERQRAAGRQTPAGLAKKDCAPPAAEAPPTGPHKGVGIVFEDLDGNGMRDAFAGEMGLAGWSVQLYYRPSGQLVNTLSTDAEGGYMFSDLGAGDWFVCVVPQSGYTQTFPAQSSDNPCGGRGTHFSVSGSIETWAMNDFGHMLN